MRILVVNAGSSSLKLRVIDSDDSVAASHDLPALRSEDSAAELGKVVRELGPVDGVGHRIVHGGNEFTAPVLIDARVADQLRSLSDLAPLHQAKSLAALNATKAALPNIPSVACFDTAFHATLPLAASTYALPAAWRRRWNLRRYGFHGLSHAYISQRAAEVLGQPLESLRLITCHLGAGASLCAVEGGRSVDTTMGFTPLEGLVMATRSGSVDPGLLLWLEEHAEVSPSELASTLENESGLLGLGGDSRMPILEARSDEGDPSAKLAISVYLHRLRAEVASMAGAMGGVDGLVFAGGVGENSPRIRAACCEGLEFLGISIDQGLNVNYDDDRQIGESGQSTAVLVVKSREDLQIARETRQLLN
jgi:acetate kinase